MGRRASVRGACILLVCFVAACNRHQASPTAPTTPSVSSVPAAAIRLTLTPAELPADGGSTEVRIETLANEAGTVAAPNVSVSLDASGGELSARSLDTDNTGHAVVTWTGRTSATITVRSGDVISTSAVRVAGTTPPGPGPDPGPAPTPIPPAEPNHQLLFVDIFPTTRHADPQTPVLFTPNIRSADGRPVGSLTYAWDFNEDGVTDSTEITPTHLFTPRDHWTVRLRAATNDGRSGEGTVDIIVGATPPPEVRVTLTASPRAVLPGSAATFTAVAVPSSTAGTITTYEWDLDPATPGIERTTSTSSTTASTTFSYTTEGVRTVTVTARTTTGTIGTATTTVDVTTVLSVDFNLIGARTAPSTQTLTAIVTGPGSEGALRFDWDFGDGTTITQNSGTPNTQPHTFTLPGTYLIKVTVTAADGRTATKTNPLVVTP